MLGNGNQGVAGETQYLAVNIVNVGATPTRAAVPGYEDGTTEESKIKKIRFYFFHADGSAYKLEGPTVGTVENYLEKDITDTDMGTADGTGTVGAITKAILVINGTTKKAPASVIAVVNPQSLTSLGTSTYPEVFMILIVLDCIKFKLFVVLLCHMRSFFSMSLLYHAYVYLEFLILACTNYILAPLKLMKSMDLREK